MTEATRKARKPRKRKAERLGDSIGFRCPVALKRQLEAAAKGAGRSLSTEVQLRCEVTFRSEQALIQALDLLYGRPAAGIVLAIARALKDAGVLGAILAKPLDKDAPASWISDAFAYQQARAAALGVLDAFTPPGDPTLPRMVPAIVVDAGGSRPGRTEDARDYSQLGAEIAAGIIDAVASGKRDDDLGAWAGSVREMLGPTLTRRAAASAGKGR